MEVAALGLRVDGAAGIERAADALDGLTGAADRAERSTQDLGKGSDAASRAMRSMDAASNRSAGAIANLAQVAARAGAVLGAAFSVRALVQYADAWSDMQSKVGSALRNMSAAPEMMKRIVDIANASYSPLQQTVEVYSRNVATFRDLGLSASAAADFTEAMNHALVTTATKGQDADVVVNSLSRALATGGLNAMDFDTIVSRSPRVLEAMADKLGTTTSGLRAMAIQGRVTSSVIAFGLIESLGQLRKEAGEMPATVSDAFTRVRTNITELVGKLDQASGASAALSGFIIDIADAIRKAGDDLDGLKRDIDAFVVLVEIVGEGLDAISGLLKEAGVGFKALGENITTSFEQSLLDTAREVDGLYDAIFGTIARLEAGFKALGENITSALKWAFDWAKYYAENVVFEFQQAMVKIGWSDAAPFQVPQQPEAQPFFVSIRDAADAAGAAIEGSLGAYEKLRARLQEKADARAINEIAAAFDAWFKGETNAAAGATGASNAAGALTKKLTEAQKAAQAFAKAREDDFARERDRIRGIDQEAQALEDQVALFGLSKTAVEDLAIARLEEQAVVLRGFAGSEDAVALIEKEIEARTRLRNGIASLETREAEKAAWESWQRDIGQIFDQVGQSLTDALFEGGKSGRDLVKDLFKTLTLRVLVQPVMGALQGVVTQGLGGVFGLQDQKQGGAGGLLGTASNLSTLYGAVTGGLTSTVASSIASAGSFFGSTAATSFAAGMQGSTLAAGLAGPTTAGASGAMGAGATFGAVLPWVGGALAVGSILASTGVLDGLFGGSSDPRSNSASVYYRGQGAGLDPKEDYEDWAGDAAAQSMQALSQSVADTIDRTFAAVGSEIATHSVRAWYQTSENGKGGVQVGGVLTGTALDTQLADDFYRYLGPESGTGRQFGDFLRGTGFGGTDITVENLQTNLAAEANRAILMAFQEGIDAFPSVIQQQLASLDASSLNADQLASAVSGVVGMIEQITALRDAMNALPFANLHDLSLDAAAGLLQLSGGLENLASAQQTYLQNFYSEAERQQIAVGNLTTALAAAGVEMPALIGSADAMRAQYRALIEAQNLETEAGRQAYIVLMNNAGAFSQVADSAQAAAQASQQAAQAAAQQRTDYYKSALDAVNRFGQQQIAALQQTFGETDQAMQAYRTAFQDVQRQWQGLLSALDQGIKSLRGSADSAFERQYTEARARISTALVTGQISDKSAMTDAIKIAQQGVTGGIYASQFDQEKAYLVLANQLEGLQNIAQPELDAATATLEQLEAQYALLRGTKRTLDDSLDALKTQVQQAMTAEEAARVQIDQIQAQIDWAQKQYDELTGTRSDMVGGFQSLADALAAFSKPVPGTTGTGGAITGVVPGPGEPADVSAGSITSRALDYLSNNPDVATAWNQDSGGLSFQQFAVMHYEKYGQYEGRKFARGGYYPGGLALVGEEGPELINFRSPGQVYTADQTHDILRRGVHPQAGADRELIAEVRRLREDNRAMRQELSAIRKSTTQLAEQFDQVSAGGNALATETF